MSKEELLDLSEESSWEPKETKSSKLEDTNVGVLMT